MQVVILRLLTALPLIFGWRKMKISLAIYCGLNTLSEVISTIFSLLDIGKSGKGFIQHNFILIATSFAIIYFYSDLYKLSKYWLSLIYTFYIVLFLVTQLYFFDDFFIFNTYSYSFLHFLLILFSSFGFYKVFKEESIIYIEKSAFFWLNSAFLFFSSGALVISVFSKYLLEIDIKLERFFWVNFFYTICCIFYTVLAYAMTLKDDEHFPIFRSRRPINLK
jgi:hypothetical protein